MKFKKSVCAAATALMAAMVAVCASGATAFAAVAAGPFADPSYSYALGDGFTYKECTVSDSGGNQAMFMGEYKPSASSGYELVIHSVRDGSETTRSTVMEIAEDYENTTGRKVIFAANGDYFDLNTGSNIESYVNDGVVISKGSYATKHCIGFDNNGKSVVGRMTQVQKRLLVEKDGEKRFFEIDKINAEPSDGELAVYTSPGTYTVKDAGKYVVYTDSVNLTQYPVWGVSHRTTTGTALNDDAFTVRSGQFAVVVKDAEEAAYFFENLVYGVNCSLVEIPDGDFKGCDWVLGGYDILVDGGVVNANCHTDNDGNGYAPRTMIGFKEDGTAFICVVDGRQGSYSKGITVNREAQLAKELGAYNALELDGGGSSTVIVRIDDKLTLRNKPSDGTMRKVSNAVMLVEKPAAEPDEPVVPVTPPDTTPDDGGNKGAVSCSSVSDGGGTSLFVTLAAAGAAIAAIMLIRKRGAQR